MASGAASITARPSISFSLYAVARQHLASTPWTKLSCSLGLCHACAIHMALYHCLTETSMGVVNIEIGAQMQDEIRTEWVTYKQAQRLTSLGRTTLWRLV